MRQFIIIGLLLAFSISSFSQKFGFRIGANFTNMVVKDNDDTYSDKYKTALGGHLGFVSEIPVKDFLAIQTGFTIAQKGYKIREDNLEWNTYLFYVDIPVNVLFKLDLKSVKIFAGAGPNIGIGAYGLQNWEITNALGTVTDDNEIKWGSGDESDLKRLDLGLNLTAGIEYGAMQFGVCYTPALSNIAPKTDNGYSVKNKLFSVSMAFLFGK